MYLASRTANLYVRNNMLTNGSCKYNLCYNEINVVILMLESINTNISVTGSNNDYLDTINQFLG